MRNGGKTETLLFQLALRGPRVPRERLLASLWPNNDAGLASQSLNSLVYSLQKLIGDATAGRPSVLYAEGCYSLNPDAGISVDVHWFERLVSEGDRAARTGNLGEALRHYNSAANFYSGDLSGGGDVTFMMERERLRSRYLTVLARLADHYYANRDYAASLEWAVRMLQQDPCREDAHRLAMRCYVRLGARSEALRQYRLCEQVLRSEFDATPESETTELFNQVRLNPAGI